jgi:hypothetical protein
MADALSFKLRFQHLLQHSTTVSYLVRGYEQFTDHTSSQQWSSDTSLLRVSLHIFDHVAPRSLQKINKKVTSHYCFPVLRLSLILHILLK